MRSILDFRARLRGSGARPNLFRVVGRFPTLARAGLADDLISFHAESTSLPADKLGEIEVPYMGRKTYYPGDREFDPWTISVIVDENFMTRDAFERWLSALNSHVGNTRSFEAAFPEGYTSDWIVQQLSKLDLPPIKQYKLASVFPTEVGEIEVDWGTNNTIEKFKVNLRYQWWESQSVAGGQTTDGGGIPILG